MSKRGGNSKASSKRNAKTSGSQKTSNHKKSRTTAASNKKHSSFAQSKNNRSHSKATRQDSAEPLETKLFMLNKPFEVLCQFTDQDGRTTLAQFIKQPGLYPAGRLDRDSEGLLLLTNNGVLQHRISHPDFKLPKEYLVQVEGLVEMKALKKLQLGVELKDGLTAPAKAEPIEPPDWLWERNPPIRFRKEKPTSWIKLTITEGKNRQVRRMTAAVGLPTLRLIRSKIGKLSIEQLQPGEYTEIEPSSLHS